VHRDLITLWKAVWETALGLPIWIICNVPFIRCPCAREFPPLPPHVPYGLRGLISRLWLNCNTLLRLGRPWGTVTLSQWGGWWVIYEYEYEGALNLSSTELPRLWSLWESSPSRKNPHGRTGNRTWNLMINSKKLWPLYHETGLCTGNLSYKKSAYTGISCDNFGADETP
jgi:hypothetical protein